MKRRMVLFFWAAIAAPPLFSGAASAADSPPLARPRITGIANVALQARDLARSRVFYKDFLGYAEPSWGRSNDGELPPAWIKINDHQLIKLRPEDEPGSDRLQHVGLVTENAEALRHYLAARGCPVPAELDRDGCGDHSFTVRDPEGRKIRFVEYTPESWVGKTPAQDLPATRVAGRIRHVGFMVADLRAALEFYVGILGFEETWRGSADDRTLSWVNLKVPDGDEYLELMLYDPAAPPDPDRRGVLNHICLEVGDVGLAERTLQARALPAGCKATSAPKTGRNGKRQINCYDPDGTRTEIMEPGTHDGRVVPSSPTPPPGRTP